MRKSYIIDTVTRLDIQEIVRIGGKLIQIFEGIIDRESFQKSPHGKIIEKLFSFRQKYKDEGNDLTQRLIKFFLNALYGIHIRKVVNEICKCRPQHRMETEHDDNLFWKN